MIYLSIADVLNIWGNVLETDRLTGIRNYDLLASAVNKPKLSFYGQEVYKGAIVKAVVLCEAIIKNHPFIDGNKRTGVMAMLAFLEVNGYDTSNIHDDVLYDIAMGFAQSSLDREEAVRMIRGFLPDHVEGYTSYMIEALL